MLNNFLKNKKHKFNYVYANLKTIKGMKEAEKEKEKLENKGFSLVDICQIDYYKFILTFKK